MRGDAFSTQQVVNLLRPSTRLTEVRNNKGRFTGEHQVVVSFPDSAEDGIPIMRELSPGDAVKAMQGKPNAYGNLLSPPSERHRQRQRARRPYRRQD